jgi:hypothetical protein
MTAAAAILQSALSTGTLKRYTGTTQAVYTTIILLCSDGPRAFSAEQIGHLSGFSVRATQRGLSALLEARLIRCRPIKRRGRRDRFTGMYEALDPAKLAEMD